MNNSWNHNFFIRFFRHLRFLCQRYVIYDEEEASSFFRKQKSLFLFQHCHLLKLQIFHIFIFFSLSLDHMFFKKKKGKENFTFSIFHLFIPFSILWKILIQSLTFTKIFNTSTSSLLWISFCKESTKHNEW
jgi:hypothetical protein